MADDGEKSRFHGVEIKTNRNGQKRYPAYLSVLKSWPDAVRERCGNKAKLYLGTWKVEEPAASAVDQAEYIAFADQPNGCPMPPNLPDLLTPDLCAALAGVTIEEKIDEWAIANGTKLGTSRYRGVTKCKSGYLAQAYHPLTGEKKYFYNSSEDACGRWYDCQLLTWHAASVLDKLNFPLATYRNLSTNAAVAQIVQEIEAGGNPRGDYGPFEDKRRLKREYKAGTLDLTLYPAFNAATDAPAAPRRNRPAANTNAAPTAAAAATLPGSNNASGTVVAEEYPDSEYSSDEDYESEYDSEGDNDNPTHQMDISNALLCTEEEAEILQWLEEQGCFNPFSSAFKGLDPGQVPDDPHGVLEHLAGPDWYVPPEHPEARKLWRAEIKYASEHFEEESRKIAEAHIEKNSGYDPENYKVNGQYPDVFVHWLISSGYIDAEGNTLRKVPTFDQWIKETEEKMEKESADRQAAAEAGVEYVPPPKPVVPEGYKPFGDDMHLHLPPGLEKMYLPHGPLALLSLNHYHTCKTRREIDRKIRQCKSIDGFFGPDGQLSLENIGEAFKRFGEDCTDVIRDIFEQGDLRDWFIVNSAALYKMCGSYVNFLPKPEPEPEQPEPIRQQFPIIEGTAEDDAELYRLVMELGTTLSNLNPPQKDVQQAQPATRSTTTEMQAIIQEKRRNLNPSLIASAQARLAELQAQEQQQAAVHPPSVSVLVTPPALPPHHQQQQQVEEQAAAAQPSLELTPEYLAYVNQLAEATRAKFQGQEAEVLPSINSVTELDYSDWAATFGGEANLNEIAALAVADIEAMAATLFPRPSAGAAAPEAQPVAMDTEEPMVEEDFVERWEHVRAGYAERMKQAEVDGDYKLIDLTIAARQAQLKVDGSRAVCDALDVEESIDKAVKDLVQRKRCEEWNWKVGLAVQQNLDHWLHDILGDDWKAIIAAHPDGLVFGNHRRAPDMYDPLEIQGIYDDDERYAEAGLTRFALYEMVWKDAQVKATGPTMEFFDSLYRYWEPVIVANPLFCGRPAKIPPIPGAANVASTSTATNSAASTSTAAAAAKENERALNFLPGSLPTMKAYLVSEDDFDADDIAFLTEAEAKVERAGKKRRKDIHYHVVRS